MVRQIKNVMVIKHGALGDFINATGAFAAIRDNHPHAHLTLITGKAYVELAKKTGFFHEVLVDDRDRFYQDFFKLRSRMKTSDRIYDLQNSSRTSLYYLLLRPGQRPEWSGIAPLCDFPQRRSDRELLHAYDRFADQLRLAGLDLKGKDVLYPDMSWIDETVSVKLPPQSVLLVPGSSKTGQYKRWPPEYYGALAQFLIKQNCVPVLIAGPDDLDAASIVKSVCPKIIDLTLQLNFLQIASLAQQACAVVGNDTGPLHILAAMKLPTLVLWSKASPPDVYAPKGAHVHVAYHEELKNLPLEKVQSLVLTHLLTDSSISSRT